MALRMLLVGLCADTMLTSGLMQWLWTIALINLFLLTQTYYLLINPFNHILRSVLMMTRIKFMRIVTFKLLHIHAAFVPTHKHNLCRWHTMYTTCHHKPAIWLLQATMLHSSRFCKFVDKWDPYHFESYYCPSYKPPNYNTKLYVHPRVFLYV